MPDKKPVLLIGPLPPGWGGARVSFKLFYDYIKQNTDRIYSHYNIPVRPAVDENAPIKTKHLQTIFLFLKCLAKIHCSEKVIVFGSRNFCHSYGSLIVLMAKCCKKKVYIRFFGGHPAINSVKGIPLIGKLSTILLSKTDKLFVETYIGSLEFPSSMREKIEVVVGYRPKIETKAPGTKDEVIRCVYTGHITKEKGVDDLLKAFSMLCNKIRRGSHRCELHLYGTGPAELIEHANNTTNVIYHGRVNNSQLRTELTRYDVFVFPSTYDTEGHPGSIIEAMMAGLPVIATALPGVTEIIRHRENGILFEKRNAAELASAMELLTNDFDLRNNLSKGALATSKDFDAALVMPKLAAAMGLI